MSTLWELYKLYVAKARHPSVGARFPKWRAAAILLFGGDGNRLAGGPQDGTDQDRSSTLRTSTKPYPEMDSDIPLEELYDRVHNTKKEWC